MSPAALIARRNHPQPFGSSARQRQAATPMSQIGKRRSILGPASSAAAPIATIRRRPLQKCRRAEQNIVPSLVIERPERNIAPGEYRQRPALAEKIADARADHGMGHAVAPFRPV